MTVSVADAFGNPVPSSRVTLSGNGFGFASGTLSVSTSAGGVATFSDLVVDTAGTGYTISATDNLVSTASSPFNITAATPAEITFLQQPTDGTAGSALNPAVSVRVTDAYGNPISGTKVTLSASGFNFTSGTLAESTNSSGIATFPDLVVDTAGTGYVIDAAVGTVSGASNPFSITAAAPATLNFSQEPTTTTAGTAISPAVVVTVDDVFGNPVANTKVKLKANGFGFASGTTTVATGAGGSATFPDLVVDTAGTGYTISAFDGLISTTSTAFSVTAAGPATLSFSQQPSSVTAGTAISPAVSVSVSDAYGNPVANSNVTLSANGFSFASGTLTEATGSGGIASFGDLVVDTAGSGYTITATDGSAVTTSSQFAVTSAAVASLRFSTEPSSGIAGAALSPAVVVTALDAFGNPVPNANVALAAKGFSFASGTTTVTTNSSGKAIFSDLIIDTAGTGFTLVATDGAVSATSTPFDIGASLASTLSFSQQPSDGTAAVAIAPAVAVTVLDAFGNAVPASPVVLGGEGFSFAGGTLSRVTNASGLATFPGLVVDAAGTGYKIGATDGSASATSSPFAVTAAAPATLSFVQQPTNASAGSAISPSVSVRVMDAFGNTVGITKVTISPHGFGFAAGTLAETTNSTGLATFGDLVIDTSGTGYTLSAIDASASALSSPFDVTASAGAKLVFSTQPEQAVVGAAIPSTPAVTLTDRFGNPVAGSHVTVTLATNPGHATLTGALTSVTNALGVATFPGLAIDRTGAGYRLGAKSGTEVAASIPFDVARDGTTTTIISVDHAVVGQRFTVHVQVSGDGAITEPLTGTVQIEMPAMGAVTCTATLISGIASCTLAGFGAGSTALVATYRGNSYYAVSTGDGSQTIAKAATRTTLTISPEPSTPAHPVTITAVVRTAAPGGGTPAGTIAITDGSLVLCPAARLTAGGSATCTAYIPVTIHQTISGRFSGSENYLGSVTSTRHGVGHGYWLVASDGGVFSFGDARFYGSMGGRHLNKPMVGISGSADGKGYWTVATDGGIFTYGDASFFGSTGSFRLRSPVVGMVSTLTGKGYYLVAADGGLFAFGDAAFYGSTGGRHIPAPIVGMVLTQGGLGYYLVGADGSIYPFGDAVLHGSTDGTIPPGVKAVGLAPLPDLSGYWVAASNGNVYNFGRAHQYGNAPAPATPVVAVVGEADGKGYWLCTAAGRVYNFGSAQADGSLGSAPRKPVVSMADL